MNVLTRKDLFLYEEGPPPSDGPQIPSAIREKLNAGCPEEEQYTGPDWKAELNTEGMAQSGVVEEPANPQNAAKFREEGPGKKQAIGRAVPVAWLLYQLSRCVATGQWAIRMAAEEDGGIWIEGQSWNNDWPKIGTDP